MNQAALESIAETRRERRNLAGTVGASATPSTATCALASSNDAISRFAYEIGSIWSSDDVPNQFFPSFPRPCHHPLLDCHPISSIIQIPLEHSLLHPPSSLTPCDRRQVCRLSSHLGPELDGTLPSHNRCRYNRTLPEITSSMQPLDEQLIVFFMINSHHSHCMLCRSTSGVVMLCKV